MENIHQFDTEKKTHPVNFARPQCFNRLNWHRILHDQKVQRGIIQLRVEKSNAPLHPCLVHLGTHDLCNLLGVQTKDVWVTVCCSVPGGVAVCLPNLGLIWILDSGKRWLYKTRWLLFTLPPRNHGSGKCSYYPIVKERNLGGTHFQLPWLWEEKWLQKMGYHFTYARRHKQNNIRKETQTKQQQTS